MHWFTQLFVALLLIGTLFKIWLSRRQIRAQAFNRDTVPKPFDEAIKLDDHRKACDYTAARSRAGIWDHVLDAAVLLAWTVGGGFAVLDALWRGLAWGPVATGVAVILSATLIGSIIALPLSAYSTFGIEERFGFNKTTPGLFITDYLKGLAVGFVIGAPLIAVFLYLMSATGREWWLYAWIFWVSFSLALTWAYPAFIAPLFNKFSPLSDSELRERIESLLARCGFRSNGIFVMDGSRRSTHGNAYFTGVGNNKRIVFFDTLINTLSPEEIEAVLAHELGHFRKKHVRKRLIVMFALGLVGLAILGWLKEQSWFYTSLGVDVPSDYAALFLFVMVLPVFTFALTPLNAYFSRRQEFEADEYAAEQSDAKDMIRALVKLYRENATALAPDRLHSTFYDSHPPGPARVAHLTRLTSGA